MTLLAARPGRVPMVHPERPSPTPPRVGDRTSEGPGSVLVAPPGGGVSRLPAVPSTTRLPFDVYQRYRLVADVVEHVARHADAGTTSRLAVLDVGGGTGLLRAFLPDHDVTLVDVQPSERGDVLAGFVLGDGSHLPFADGAFDLVVTCDTLEHLPRAAREAFLAESARCARRGVVVAGPYRAERVDEAEETLRAFLREKLGLRHRYLEEHREHGLPVRAEVEASFERRGLRVTSVGHGNVDRWLALLCASMYMDQDPHLRRIAEDVYAFYNEALYASDVREPVYRHAVVALAPGVPLPRPEELFGEAPPPAGSLQPFVHLAAELFAFDRERDVYDAERSRLTAVVDGLVRDLDGHKARARTLEDDLAGHAASLVERDRDLAGHRDLAGELQRLADERLEALTATELDLEGHRRTVEALRGELEERARHAGELQRELEGVRAEAAEERATLVRERDEQRAVIDDREASLAEHRALVDALRAELTTRREYAEQLERELREAHALASRVNEELGAEAAALRAENAALREELASRWRSLKRALRKRAG